MKKTLLPLLTLLLVIAVSLPLFSCSGSGSYSDTNGTIGELTWTFEGKTGKLTVTGAGAIPDYASSDKTPWASVAAGIQSIELKEGVTAVGAKAFYATAAESVTLAPSVGAIGKLAFAYMPNLAGIALSDGVQTVGDSAFEGCGKLEVAKISVNVTSVGTDLFAYCRSLKTVLILPEVLPLPEGTFRNCASLEKLVIRDTFDESTLADSLFAGSGKTKADLTVTKTATPNASGTITVNYTAPEGVTLEKTTVSEDHVYGEIYTIISPSVAGYTPDQATVSGTSDGTDKTIEVKYTAVGTPVTPEGGDSEPEPVEPEEKKNPVITYITVGIFALLIVGIVVAVIVVNVRDKKKAQAEAAKGKKKN